MHPFRLRYKRDIICHDLFNFVVNKINNQEIALEKASAFFAKFNVNGVKFEDERFLIFDAKNEIDIEIIYQI